MESAGGNIDRESGAGSSSLIEVEDLKVTYYLERDDRELVAVEGVSFSVNTGEFLTVLGPSGCGKTTVLNVIAGLVHPSAGRVAVDGMPVRGPGPDRAVVFQNYALLPWRTVYDNVRFGIEMAKPKLPTSTNAIEETIELVGLQDFRNSYPHELSGGMQQRVGLARALVSDPQILLMDEPLGAVDALTREVMRAELERIIGETGKTVVFITHSIDEAILLGDRVVVFQSNPGSVREIIPVGLDRPRHGEHVQGDPTFGELRHYIWTLLKDEATASVRGDRG
jgi:NitT/TauT family transport system ATP-binding protein